MKKHILIVVLSILICSNLTVYADNIWGRLANPGFENQAVKSAYFFTGNWKNGVKFYEFDAIPNTGLYTIHPSDARHLGWSENISNREFAVNTLIDAGVNVINMSYWGPPGTDNWAYWAPMQTSAYSHDELFNVAVEKDILIAPYIESYAATDSSDEFSFMDCFPGTSEDPAPELVYLIKNLVTRYITDPENAAWPAKWAQIYDQSGEKRYLISVIHAASNQAGINDQLFAQGFDLVAGKVYDDTGIRIGFTIDALPPSGTYAPGIFKPSPSATGPWLYNQSSVLAVQGFIPEIWTGVSNEDSLIQWKYQYSTEWINTGIPYILDISPGYDAHIVFPESPVYGNNNSWRNAQVQLINDLSLQSITVNTWNGYTEGFACVPSLEYGNDTYKWICALFSGVCEYTISALPAVYEGSRCKLYQNYPNPFNKSTMIRFDLSRECEVELKIYDLHGSEIMTILNERRPAGENYVSWHPGSMPEGLYCILLDVTGSKYIIKSVYLNGLY